MHPPPDVPGNVYGRLTLLKHAPRGKQLRHVHWWCRCTCGTVKIIAQTSMRQGLTLSCGCHRRELNALLHRTHGQAGTPLYHIWQLMVRRCYKPGAQNYLRYGGRGIRVCARWRHSFAAFASDMAPRPSPQHSIERINNEGHYEPGNCTWATRREQGANKRNNVWVTYKGQRRRLVHWADSLRVHPAFLRNRLKRGWTVEQAFTTPVRQANHYKHGRYAASNR